MILDAIQSGIFWLLLKIDAIVFTFVNWTYQIILLLASGNILENNTFVSQMVNRLYVVVGVVVLFIVAYTLLRNMTNPDEAIKGKESPVKLISNVIISIVLIALVPSIFTFAMDFQNALLKQNTLGKIILGETYSDGSGNSYNSENVISNGGFEIASTVFQAFFQPNTTNEAVAGSGVGYCTGKESIDTSDCIVLDGIKDNVEGGTTDYATWWKNNVDGNKSFFSISQLSSLVASDKITYNFFFSTIAGAFVVIVLVSYAFDIAIRLVKLAVYQLLAPIFILARIVPKDDVKKVFGNWLKATISTYLEVFIRLAVLFFCVFIIKIVNDNFGNIIGLARDNWGTVNPVILLLAQAFVILGIIMFVKQAPGIIKELTGLDGNKYNPLASAMKGFNAVRSIPKTLARSFTNTDWDKNHKLKSAWNKFKNPLKDMGSALIKNHESEYKGLGDLNKNYDKITTDSLAERRRKEAIRKAKQTSHDKNKAAGMPFGIDWKEGFIDYVKGSADTKAIEEKIKLSDSVGKDIKSKIIDEAIDKNLRVKQLDNAWKALQNKAVDAADYFERVTAENFTALGLTMADVGKYYDASTGSAIDFNTATEQARLQKQAQEGDLKKQRDKAAFETMWGAIRGDYSVFDASDVDSAEKQKFVTEYFSNLQSQFNTDIEYAQAKNKDIAIDPKLSARIDVASMASASALKDAIGDRKLAADTLTTGYNKELAETRSKEQLKAEIKGDSK